MNKIKETIFLVAFFAPLITAHADPGRGVTAAQILTAYSAVHAPLVVDDLETAFEGTKVLRPLVTQWLSENPEHAEKLSMQDLERAVEAFNVASDIDDARKSFIQISKGVIALIRSEKLTAQWQLFFCPMVAKQQGYWVQPVGQKLANPYMGSVMPGCGSKKPW